MIDCHVHFSGSIPVNFVWDVIKSRGWGHLASSMEDVRESIEYDGSLGFDGFLNKFRLFDELLWDVELLDLSIKAVAESIVADGLDFVWLDFSINKYLHSIHWHKRDLIKFFYDRFEFYAPGRIGLVLSVKYESLEVSRRQYLELINDDVVRECLVGLDLVGDEKFFDVGFYAPYFREWARCNKMLRVHVGEVGRIDNVESALRFLPVTNIAHGIDIVGDANLVSLARDMGVQFDLALTSNLLIRGMSIGNHPIYDMIDMGLKCTIGSDDPVVFKTNLSQEFDYVDESTKAVLRKNALDFTKSYGFLL